jgi:hypothetical protein
MMALLISPCADSTIISRTSLEGAIDEVEKLDEKWILSIACKAFLRRVGAMGLNL